MCSVFRADLNGLMIDCDCVVVARGPNNLLESMRGEYID